jgi:hypothetical protein
MHLRAMISAIVLVVAVGRTTACAQVVTQSTLSGIETSASTTIGHNPTGTAAAPVFTTPATGFFILTQACFTRNSRVTLSGNTVGVIVHSRSNSRKCTTYTPGIALPHSQTLTCTNASKTTDQTCTVNGILSTK